MSESRFLARWSRLKKISETASNASLPDGEMLLANLGPGSDFGQFLRQEISEEIRRKAMKTLFADPHFNVMDGLDIYIDDYAISEPIPDEMMALLNQTRALLEDPGVETVAATDATQDCDILPIDGQNVSPPPPGTHPASDTPPENQ